MSTQLISKNQPQGKDVVKMQSEAERGATVKPKPKKGRAKKIPASVPERDEIQRAEQHEPSSELSASALFQGSVPISAPKPMDVGGTVSMPEAETKAMDGWQVVNNKRPRRSASIRGTAAPNLVPLKAVEYRKHIHLWNMASGSDEVLAYVKSLCPTGTCTLEELRAKGDYKSFKISVPAIYYDKCLSPQLWPENARIKPWLFRGSPSAAKKTEQ